MFSSPHLFLDRDGTLIREEHYLRDPAKVVLESGVYEGLQRFACAGFRLVVISNQSGVGRGLISEDDVNAVNERVAKLLSAHGVSISSWHYCPHLPDEGCLCRKPGTRLFESAAAQHPVDWEQSIMVGDKPSDVQAGLSLGMKAVLITTGYGSKYIEWALTSDVHVVRSLVDLADIANLGD
jgi:D-glycero-D-manno-heptose 1,7-bisphosphate phosphatase